MDEHPHPALGRRRPERLVLGRLAGRVRPPARVADEDLDRLAAELVGLRQRPRDQPLADLDVGADRVAAAGRGRRSRRDPRTPVTSVVEQVAQQPSRDPTGQRQMMERVIVLPLGTIVPDGGSTRVDVADAEVVRRRARGSTSKPAASSSRCRASSTPEATRPSGTSTSSGPCETTRVTVSPRKRVPPAGVLGDDEALGDRRRSTPAGRGRPRGPCAPSTCSARSALLPTQSRTSIGLRPLADDQVDDGARACRVVPALRVAADDVALGAPSRRTSRSTRRTPGCAWPGRPAPGPRTCRAASGTS